MARKKILSIVAEAPKDVTPPREVMLGDGNIGIEQIVTAMEQAQQGGKLRYDAFVERAAYVFDLAGVLDQFTTDHGAPPDVLQIVGHGSPGRLELGQHWARRPYGPGGYMALDSNTNSYGALDERLKPNSVVLLIGCFTGSSERRGAIANGPALLTDIEQMAKDVRAYAPDGPVNPGDFRDGFLYAGTLSASNGRPANLIATIEGGPAETVAIAAQPEPVTLRPLRVLSAPVLGVFDDSQEKPEIPPKLKAWFGESYQEVKMDRPLLAMTELEVQLEGFAAPAQFVCAGRFVRVFDGTRTRYFARVPLAQAREPWDRVSQRLADAVVLRRHTLVDIQ